MDSRPDVVVGIIQKYGEILLQYRINTPRCPNHWGLPAGTVESKESGAGAIHREMMEELGISVTTSLSPVLTCIEEGNKRFDAYLIDSYKGELRNNEPQFCRELSWFNPDQLPSPLTPATARILSDYFEIELDSESR